jgi:hypothetical protein
MILKEAILLLQEFVDSEPTVCESGCSDWEVCAYCGVDVRSPQEHSSDCLITKTIAFLEKCKSV